MPETEQHLHVAPGDSGCWYALYTRHQHEKTASQILSGKGFEIFLPLYTVSRRWKDRTKELSLPLFPCYVFLRGGLERRLDILTTPGVHNLVGSAGRPAAIPESEIEAVRRVVEKDTTVESYPFLKCGDWVRVKSGSLEGIEGILVRKKNSFRLIISVEVLEKSVGVELDASDVERSARPNLGAPTRWIPTNVRTPTSDVRPLATGTRRIWS